MKTKSAAKTKRKKIEQNSSRSGPILQAVQKRMKELDINAYMLNKHGDLGFEESVVYRFLAGMNCRLSVVEKIFEALGMGIENQTKPEESPVMLAIKRAG